jgi:glycosyltransferase involved in cell wall biosynthesis
LKPSVCFVAPQAWPVFSRDPAIPVAGGAEVQQSILARLLAAAGYRVSMICLDYGQPQGVRLDGVEIRKVFRPREGLPVLRFLYPRLTSMWRALREVDAHIYYYRSASMWVGVLAEFCRRYGRRAIYAGASDRDFLPDQGGQIRHARDRWLYRRGLERVDRIVAQNEVQRTTCREHYKRDAVVIPSCYQVESSRRTEANDCVLWVGTLHANKRPQILLDVAARLPHRRFVMIGGPGAERAVYEDVKRRAAGIPNLEFKGFQPLPQVESWFDRARVLLNTSLYEGMPNTFLQAWARGVPTVATVAVDAPGHRFASGADELAGAVDAAFDDPVAGAECRRYFERSHSAARTLERYEELFEELRA